MLHLTTSRKFHLPQKAKLKFTGCDIVISGPVSQANPLVGAPIQGQKEQQNEGGSMVNESPMRLHSIRLTDYGDH